MFLFYFFCKTNITMLVPSKSWVTVTAVVSCWLLSILLATPLLLANQLVTHTFPSFSVSYCTERWDWAWSYTRVTYSLVVFLVQLLLPATIITCAHCAIHR